MCAGAADVEPRAWVTPTLVSGDGVEMPLGYPSDDEAALISPTRPAWAPQDHQEPILLAYLRTAAIVTVRFGCELVEVRQDDRGVHAVVFDHPSHTTRHVDAVYVIAADGAHSSLRDQFGIAMVGPDDLADYERVEFRAPLAELVGDRRCALYVITLPDAAGVLAPRGRGDRWGFSRERTAGEAGLADHDVDELAALLARAAGVDRLPAKIERCSRFTFAAQIAERYRERRAFLVGDAAHRMTPRGGTGMNTAIQDAFDLGWKMGWVLRRWATPDLLDSYETDRRPVGLHNVERAGEPGGAHSSTRDALAWDLNGRIAHHWIRHGDHTVSTLDLIGDGLTLFAGPRYPRRTQANMMLQPCAPITTYTLDTVTAEALDLKPGGALLLRPDGRQPSPTGEMSSTTDYDSPEHRGTRRTLRYQRPARRHPRSGIR